MKTLIGISDHVIDKLQKKPTVLDPDEVKRSREENDRLTAMVETLGLEKARERIRQHIAKRHKYHGVDRKGDHHLMEHPYPALTHSVIERHADGRIRYNFTDNAILAEKVAKNLTLSREEHQAIIDDRKKQLMFTVPHLNQEARVTIAHHEKLMVEADGKTAEVIQITRLLQE